MLAQGSLEESIRRPDIGRTGASLAAVRHGIADQGESSALFNAELRASPVWRNVRIKGKDDRV